MAKYSKSLLDLLKEEDHIVTEIQLCGDRIIHYLHITEESSDKNEIKEAKEKVDELYDQADKLKMELDAIDKSIKNRLFTFLQYTK